MDQLGQLLDELLLTSFDIRLETKFQSNLTVFTMKKLKDSFFKKIQIPS